MKDVKLCALKWWYKNRSKFEVGDICAKDEFLRDRTAWEELEKEIHNECSELLGHDKVKKLISGFDRSGIGKLNSIEEAEVQLKENRRNSIEFGTTAGPEKFRRKVEKMGIAVAKDFTPEYLDYIKGPVWSARSLRYLDDRCIWRGHWICEICGKLHRRDLRPRTIQVHHTRYDLLDGKEPDAFLLGVCKSFCHPLADVARKVQRGKIDPAILNDALKPLLATNRCPHGEEPHECNECMVESDFAYDVAREGRVFGR